MSTNRTIRDQRKAKQTGIPADHIFDVTRALMRDQRKSRTATALEAPQSRARVANSKG
jgi:hypothetical protein